VNRIYLNEFKYFASNLTQFWLLIVTIWLQKNLLQRVIKQ